MRQSNQLLRWWPVLAGIVAGLWVLFTWWYPAPPVSDPPIRAACQASDVIITKEDITSGKAISGDNICITDGAEIDVHNGVKLAINARKKLIIEGAAVFNGRGSPGTQGTAGVTPPDFVMDNGGHNNGVGHDQARCEREFQGFGNSPDDRGGPGADGGPGGLGATIEIQYNTLLGEISGIKSDVTGGPGGPGGPGGLGRKMRCFGDALGTTRIPQDTRRGQNGKSGANGPNGTFSIARG